MHLSAGLLHGCTVKNSQFEITGLCPLKKVAVLITPGHCVFHVLTNFKANFKFNVLGFFLKNI